MKVPNSNGVYYVVCKPDTDKFPKRPPYFYPAKTFSVGSHYIMAITNTMANARRIAIGMNDFWGIPYPESLHTCHLHAVGKPR